MISPGFLQQLWYGQHPLTYALIPISWIYTLAVVIRRFVYSIGILPKRRVGVPVIIVGNISAGGTGKTPLIIWLCEYLKAQGRRPGVISRGYGGRQTRRPQQVRPDSHPAMVGDEPVLIARRTHCPVAVSKNRYQAATELLEHTDVDILLCDDGLQHLALDRDLEIAVIDGDRRFGNGHCLPAGPLREPPGRLGSVDMIVAKGKAGRNEFLMQYRYGELRSLRGHRSTAVDSFGGTSVHAVTGIANADRFHSWLRSHNIRVIRHEFPDHHPFVEADLQFGDDLPVIMTEKDAVKCLEFNVYNCWYVPIDAEMTEAFHFRLLTLLREILRGQEAA